MASLETAELEEQSQAVATFDPHTDVSADARFIVRQLTWNLILGFLVLYVALGVLAWLVSH